MGTLVDRVHRELTDADMQKIVGTYHAWGGDKDAESCEYADLPGFCRSAMTAEIAGHGYVLTPGRYVGAEEAEEEGEPYDEKMLRLIAELRGQFTQSAKLEKAIEMNFQRLGYEE